MKKILFTILLFSLVSCGNNSQGVIEETGEIVDDYVDTLGSSIQDARAISELYNQKQEALRESLEKTK